MLDRTPSFATFWHGPALSGWEAACINSYLAQGFAFVVYSYDRVDGLPERVERRDAREITPQDNLRRFLIKGQPNLSHFSDLFRYELFSRTPHVWVDADMLMLRPLSLPAQEDLLAKEDATTLCGAIMRLNPADPRLATLIARTVALRDREMPWGATGPRLLTEVFGRREVMAKAHAAERFFPVHYDKSWKLLLPAYREECEARCAQAATVHLWHDRLVKIGVWKRFAPPRGSFLESRFRADGSLGYFADAYPAAVMEAMTTNWRFRLQGGDVGLGQWLRNAVPSARITYRRRMNLPV